MGEKAILVGGGEGGWMMRNGGTGMSSKETTWIRLSMMSAVVAAKKHQVGVPLTWGSACLLAWGSAPFSQSDLNTTFLWQSLDLAKEREEGPFIGMVARHNAETYGAIEVVLLMEGGPQGSLSVRGWM